MALNGVSRACRIVLYLTVTLFLTINNSKNILPVSEAMWLTIPSIGATCVSEDIPNNNIVVAEYFVFDHYHSPRVSVRVTSPYGEGLHVNKNATYGKFSFMTKKDGNHVACFKIESNYLSTRAVRLVLDWKIGIATKDWDSIIKKEKIEGVELHLRRLEGLVKSIHEKLIHLKQREADIWNTSERTNAKAMWFSIMSIGVCITVSVLQIWRQKHYFIKKKLI